MSNLVRKKAASHGYGIYTQAVIAEGTHVLTMSGRVVDAAKVTDDMRAMQIGPAAYLVEDIAPGDDGSEDQYLDNYLNHSCEPNVGFVDGDLKLFALRELQAGEELLWDYSTSMNEPGWSLKCYCGGTGCRGKIQSFCDLTQKQQEVLLPITLNYLRKP